MKKLNETAHKLLDVAEHKTQMHGFNAFSYKDLQQEVGVKTSSIHYYFPTKQDLAFAMTERYIERFRLLLDEIAKQHKKGLNRLLALGRVYVETVEQGKFCLCGMLASDLMSLPEHAHGKLQEFFTLNELWITSAIETAKEQGEVRADLDARNAASLFLAMLEGGMLIARSRKHGGSLETTIHQAISQLKG